MINHLLVIKLVGIEYSIYRELNFAFSSKVKASETHVFSLCFSMKHLKTNSLLNKPGNFVFSTAILASWLFILQLSI